MSLAAAGYLFDGHWTAWPWASQFRCRTTHHSRRRTQLTLANQRHPPTYEVGAVRLRDDDQNRGLMSTSLPLLPILSVCSDAYSMRENDVDIVHCACCVHLRPYCLPSSLHVSTISSQPYVFKHTIRHCEDCLVSHLQYVISLPPPPLIISSKQRNLDINAPVCTAPPFDGAPVVFPPPSCVFYSEVTVVNLATCLFSLHLMYLLVSA